MVFKVTCLVVFVFGLAQAAVLPIQKCKLGDNVCLKPAFQKMMSVFMTGISENNVGVADPLEMDDLAFDLAGLQFTMTEGIMKGLKNSIVDEVVWDTKKKMFSVDSHMDITVRAHYTAGGRVLILPITGNGILKMRLKHLRIKMFVYYDIVNNVAGKDIIKPKKYTFEYEVKENAHYHMTNLFNGNKQLSEAMLSFLNANWQQVANEFGRPMVDSTAKRIFKNMAKFLATMPIEEITIE